MTFNFTRTADLNSTAVEEVYYDDDQRRLAVVLDGGNVYEYDNVPAQEFNALVNAPSAGRHYALNIKRNYGPGTYLGYVSGVDFERGVKAPDMGNVTQFPGVVPKNLTPASAQTKIISPENPLRFALAERDTASERVEYDYTVNFLSNGEPKTYKTRAGSFWTEPVEALQEIGEMLGVDIEVEDVTVHLG